VAVAFIVIEELAGAVGPIGPVGSAGLDTLGLVIDDVLVLTGGTIGGVLASLVRRRGAGKGNERPVDRVR
jgi:hypothetical protein